MIVNNSLNEVPSKKYSKTENFVGGVILSLCLIVIAVVFIACIYAPIEGFDSVLHKSNVNAESTLIWQKDISIPTSGHVISSQLTNSEKYKVVVNKEKKEIRISGPIYYCIQVNLTHDGEENCDEPDGEVVLGFLGSIK